MLEQEETYENIREAIIDYMLQKELMLPTEYKYKNTNMLILYYRFDYDKKDNYSISFNVNFIIDYVSGLYLKIKSYYVIHSPDLTSFRINDIYFYDLKFPSILLVKEHIDVAFRKIHTYDNMPIEKLQKKFFKDVQTESFKIKRGGGESLNKSFQIFTKFSINGKITDTMTYTV